MRRHFLLVCCLVAGTPARAQSGDTLADRIDAYQAAFDDANRLSGVLLIAKGDEVLLHRGYGYANVEHAVPNTLDTKFCIASITKPLTQMVVMQVVAEGEAELGDPISKWLPGFPRATEITIEHLLRHRAGIRHRVTKPLQEARPRTAADMVELAKHEPLVFEPGRRSAYSSAGYSVLARVLELVEGKPFRRILQQRIFDPLDMKNTCDPDARQIVAKRAASYVPGRGVLWNAPLKDMSFLVGAGSVLSTAADLWKLVKGVRAGRLPGVRWRSMAPSGRLRWTGASNGFHAFVDHHPEDDLTVIFLGNSWGGAPGQIRGALPRLVRGEAVAPAPRPALAPDPAPATLAALAGTYETRPGATLVVRIQAGELVFADTVLLPLGKDRFFHQAWHALVQFVRDDAGDVIAVERSLGAGVTRYARVPDERGGTRERGRSPSDREATPTAAGHYHEGRST